MVKHHLLSPSAPRSGRSAGGVRKLVAVAACALSATGVLGCEDETNKTGIIASGLVALSAEALDFGMADCGGDAAEAQSITLSNQGDWPLRWSATLDSNAHFDLIGERSGAIEPGSSATIAVAAKPMPTATAAGEIVRATLLIATNDSDHSQVAIPLTATARGATLELLAPALADFGEVPAGEPATPIAVVLRNTGNAPAEVSIAEPADDRFGFVWEGGGESAEIAPGELSSGLSATFTPSGPGHAESAGEIVVSGPVCGKSATKIAVAGGGIGGVVGISPGSLDFGKVACGTQAGSKTLTIYNTGNTLFTWSATLPEGAPYRVSQNGGGIEAGGAVTLTIEPNPVGMTTNVADDGFGATLTISTSAGGSHEIPLKQTAYGAILKFAGDELAFGEHPLFSPPAAKALTITNDGNAPADLSIDGGPFAVDPSSAKLNAGGKLSAKVTYLVDNFGEQTRALDVSVDGPLCQPLSELLMATGSGIKASAEAISVNQVPRPQRDSGWDGGCVLLANSGGRVACWGANHGWQLGTKEPTRGPNVVPKLTGVTKIAAGDNFNCAIDAAGDVWCWGSNTDGQGTIVGKLGVPDIPRSEVPVKVAGVANAVQVGTGHHFACALTNAGKVYCWGSNRHGGFGTGANGADGIHATEVPNLTDATAIAISGAGGCALKNDQTVHCWGARERGQIGDGSSSGLTGPSQVSSISGITAITAMTANRRTGTRCGLNGAGNVYCWGDRSHGQVGNGTASQGNPYTTPQQVSGISGATAIVGRGAGGCALMSDQTVRCWGYNQFGDVGDGTTSQRNAPVQVSELDDATALAAGGQATCAIVTGGSVKCWGTYGTGFSNTPTTLPYF